MVNIIIDLWDIFYYWFMKYMYFFMYVWYVDNELEFNDNIIYCRFLDILSELDLEIVELVDLKFILLEDVCISVFKRVSILSIF